MYLVFIVFLFFDFIFSFYNNKSGTILCHQWARVFSCASATCRQVGNVNNDLQFPSDCYAIGQMITDGSISNRWYKIHLRKGKRGYVNSLHCEGSVPRC